MIRRVIRLESLGKGLKRREGVVKGYRRGGRLNGRVKGQRGQERD